MKRWAQEELDFIREHTAMGPTWIGRQLGRSRPTIKHIMQNMGLTSGETAGGYVPSPEHIAKETAKIRAQREEAGKLEDGSVPFEVTPKHYGMYDKGRGR